MEYVTTPYGAGVKQSQTDQPDHRKSEKDGSSVKGLVQALGYMGMSCL
jgi:hypothetical protein